MHLTRKVHVFTEPQLISPFQQLPNSYFKCPPTLPRQTTSSLFSQFGFSCKLCRCS